MRRSRLALLAIAALLVQPGIVAARSLEESGPSTDYVVLYANGVSATDAHAAIRAIHGTVVNENQAVGVATVRTTNPFFVRDAARASAISGVTRNLSIGHQEPAPKADPAAVVAAAPPGGPKPPKPPAPPKPPKPGSAADPLAGLQWDMSMIHATPTGSYAKQLGKREVLVGVIDTGVDGTHPDIAPNFNYALSRNFTHDIPDIDGPCEVANCIDPVDEDDDGHGTHVAGTIGAALNGIGIAGVAPKVSLVNIRAGQDSGYFFLQETVNALTYAGDAGIDVVNMSFYIDPWLWNCPDNPADPPEHQAEQRTIVEATNRALDYAHDHGVTLIVAEGNGHTNLDAPTVDASSPDYPPNTAYVRTVGSRCLSMPLMGNHALGVTALGPSGAKADYSDYSTSYLDVSAPGGYFRDYFGTPQHRTVENEILSALPYSVGIATGLIDPISGDPTTPLVVRDCQGAVCGYYQYLQGTSMAAPHATGVAALIISRYGKPVPGKANKGQIAMDPDAVAAKLRSSATDHACPDPATVDYTIIGRPSDFNATCVGDASFNNFYGDGVVDALAAVTGKKP